MGKTSGNKDIKEQLIKVYGNGCMFERARIAEKISLMGGIKTFKSFKREKEFKGQKISYQLTLHHLRHRSEGGKTSLENGAVISELAHQYLHSLPREEEEYINNLLRRFKLNCVSMQGDGVITNMSTIDIPTEFIEEDYLIIPVYDNKKRDNKIIRAKQKRELRELLQDYEYNK